MKLSALDSMRLRIGRYFKSRAFSMSPSSTAVVYDKEGPPDTAIRVVEIPPVEIKEHDVCVKMLSAPINPSDINRIEGVYPIRPSLPAVGGYEGVGEVYSVGTAVNNLSIGDWVIPSPPSFGTWQSFIVKEQNAWHKISRNIPIQYAATITVNPLTALRMLEDFAPLNQGDCVVQNGATSIVGQCVIQLARTKGLRSINIVRDRPGVDEAVRTLKEIGGDEVVKESDLDVKSVKGILGNLPKPSLGLNCVGGNSASLVMKILRDGGTMVTYGGMSKQPLTVSTSSFIFKDVRLRGFWLQKYLSSDKARDTRKMIDQLLCLVGEEKLRYEMELVPFQDFHLALNKAMGKQGSHKKQVIQF